MKILIYETPDKKHRTTVDIEWNVLERYLTKDLGWFEVIPMTDPYSYVRVFFDIDHINNSDDPLDEILSLISSHFNCDYSDWAIASSHRENKRSYHIVSKKYCIQLKKLRETTKLFHSKMSSFDENVLYFPLADKEQSGYLRLPNQTKYTIHKQAPPLKIESGSIREFFVTNLIELSAL